MYNTVLDNDTICAFVILENIIFCVNYFNDIEFTRNTNSYYSAFFIFILIL